MDLAPRTKLGRYEIRSKLGQGGMGEVYLAQDTKLDRTVAIKLLAPDIATNKNRMNRFVQEAKAASALNHPNIITIHEIDETGLGQFIATEFIDGETLRELLRRDSLKIDQVVDVAVQIASALSAAHSAGIVHRDIKPENVILRRDGIVKVLDFGLAKLTEQSSSVDPEAATRGVINTEPGVVMGTAMYMSPEQARGLQVDERTDIFSLAVVMYEMLSGRLPFEGANTNEIISSILSDREPQPLARYSTEIPHELERIVSKALRKNRDERYQTSKDMLVDLKTLKRELEFEKKVESSSPPRDRLGTSHAGASGSANTLITDINRPAADTNSAVKTIGVVETLTQHKAVSALIVVGVTLAIAASYWFLLHRYQKQSLNSIAVMPFENVTHDQNIEYLSDGVTESLINSLSRLPQLRVIARNSVFSYKNQNPNLQQVAQQLNVQAVLTGRVLMQGEVLDVRVELTDTTNNSQIWGDHYQRKATDIFAVQDEIAQQVTEKLRLRLSGDEKHQLAKRDTSNAESFQCYLRGRYYWNKRSAEGIKKAIEQFQEALDHDPNYALGYVGLADSYLALELYAGLPASEVVPKARAAADRALQLDDSLSEAHATSAFINQKLWRWPEAEQELKRAISLNPNYPTARHWYAYYFYITRNFDGASSEIKRAYELDPLSPVISENVALVYLLKNDLKAAIEQCLRTIELDPNFADAHYVLGFAYLKAGRIEEATAEFQKSVDLSGRASTYLGNLGYCYAVTGRRAEALTILKELEEKYTQGKSSAQFLAGVYAGLGEKDQAFAWLEKDFQQRSGQLPTIAWRLHFDGLRGDPRYHDLLRRMGLNP